MLDSVIRANKKYYPQMILMIITKTLNVWPNSAIHKAFIILLLKHHLIF